MATGRPFDVAQTAASSGVSTLLVGQATLGMAGVTAADYLVRHLDTVEVGHLRPGDLPAIAPFEEGVPRHHGRLYDVEGTELAALVEELFVPVGVARPYAEALFEWIHGNDVEEIVVLHGVPFPHGPEEHEVFHVATAGYRERRLSASSIQPLKGGFLDGVVGELVTRSLEEPTLDTGVFVTPTHPPGPDVDAALKLLDAVQSIYDLDVDETELRELGEQLKQYYEQLAERVAAARGEEPLASHDYPEDRMYM
ncbi:MAG: proteasome assembly chaperone family protein [Haloarculaceae archaeon]